MRRRALAPDAIHQGVHRNHLPDPDAQRGEDGVLLRSRHRQHAALRAHLDRPEHPKLHREAIEARPSLLRYGRVLEDVVMSDPVVVVPADALVEADPTPGMRRRRAIDVPGLWAGLVHTEP